MERRLLAVGLTLGILGSVPENVVADPEPIYEGKALVAWEAALKHKDTRVRFDAAFTLSKVGAPRELLTPVIAAVKDEDSAVRCLAIETLSRSAIEDPATVAALLGALKDKQILVRIEAEAALGRLPYPTVRAGRGPLLAASQDKNPMVRRVAGATTLLTGELAQGEQSQKAALKATPEDDHLRFGLGILQFVRGVERLGQALYKYGARSDNTNIPFLRLPVPKNPDPAPVNYAALRSLFDDFIRDLAAAEATLALVTDDQVKLPLRLADIRLDLTGGGKPTDRLIDIMKKVMQQEFTFLKTNPTFLVCFDRGDVAWLRAYCHLLMAMLDSYLAFDTEIEFDREASQLFAKPEKRSKGNKTREELLVKEPARLGRFRQHLLQVCALNHETWKFIRAEIDDDHEWLPNPKQRGVLGLPVRDDMINAWLRMIDELEALLNGKKLLPLNLFLDTGGKMLNVKVLLDDPPERFNSKVPFADKYLEKGVAVDFMLVFNLVQVFGDPMMMRYAVWFN